MNLSVDSSDRSDALPNGTVVDGRYTITGVIACGGMGVVHRARHEKLEIDVALKTVRRLLMLIPEAGERFVDEAKATARLRGAHIARVFDFGRLEDERPYLVMELLEGEDAADRLERVGRLSNEDTQSTLLQVCDALAEAHAAGIVHRDLKPANLFYAFDGAGEEIVKVLDFGIARSRGRPKALTVVGAGLGSPHYMAPEQIEGSAEIDHRADIWTLGIVAYELLTGIPPFEGSGISEICARVMCQKRKPIEELRPDAWPGLVSFVDRCLRTKPADRFPDILSARAALRRAKTPPVPSVIITPERPERAGRHETEKSDPATKAHVIDTFDTSPVIPGLAPRRWPKALAVLALAGAAAWIGWVTPHRALAIANETVASVSRDPMQTGPATGVERVHDAPSVARLLLRGRFLAPREQGVRDSSLPGTEPRAVPSIRASVRDVIPPPPPRVTPEVDPNGYDEP